MQPQLQLHHQHFPIIIHRTYEIATQPQPQIYNIIQASSYMEIEIKDDIGRYIGLGSIPDWHSNWQTMEHTECNHTEPIADRSQHPTPQETKYSASLYQSTCNVT